MGGSGGAEEAASYRPPDLVAANRGGRRRDREVHGAESSGGCGSRLAPTAAVPQTHPPAVEAKVDFGESTTSITGTIMKLYMFCMRPFAIMTGDSVSGGADHD